MTQKSIGSVQIPDVLLVFVALGDHAKNALPCAGWRSELFIRMNSFGRGSLFLLPLKLLQTGTLCIELVHQKLLNFLVKVILDS